MRSFLAISTIPTIFLLLLLLGSARTAGAQSALYVTGSQFYEACWQRRAKEKKEGGFKDVEADTPSQAALWARCTPLVAETMDKIGFTIGDSRPNASADARALADFCPNAFTELPIVIDRLYILVIDAIEKLGGPSTVESMAPAGWVIERALKARWPRCIDAARPYIAKTRN